MDKDFLKNGRFDKFLVLKKEDLYQYVTESGLEDLFQICDYIAYMREGVGKNPNNKYLVINADESYAPEIVEILKRNGHWG